MAALPTVGGSTDTWGTELNSFLTVAHNANGTLKDSEAIHVRDYVVGDGVTDDTAAYQAAVDDAIDQQLPLYGDWPGHSILLAGEVICQPLSSTQFNHFFRLIGSYAGFQNPSSTPADVSAGKILCGNPSGPCLTFKGSSSSAGLQGLNVSGLKIWASSAAGDVAIGAGDAFRKPMVQFGDANPFGHFAISDVWMDARGNHRDGFLFYNAYNGAVRNCSTHNMVGGVSFTHRQISTFNGGNMGYYDCNAYSQNPNTAGHIGWLLKEHYSGGGNLFNSIVMSNCKMVGTTDSPNRYLNTFNAVTANGATSAGSATVLVSSGTNIHPGQMLIFVNVSNNHAWVDMVESISTNTITLSSGSLANALVNGDRVITGNWHTVCDDTVRSVKILCPHWENTMGVCAAGAQAINVDNPYLGNLVHRGFYAAQNVKRCTITRAIGNVGQIVLANSVLFHNSSNTGNLRNEVVACNLTDLVWDANASGGAPTNPQVIVNDIAGASGNQLVGYRDTTSWTTV